MTQSPDYHTNLECVNNAWRIIKEYDLMIQSIQMNRNRWIQTIREVGLDCLIQQGGGLAKIHYCQIRRDLYNIPIHDSALHWEQTIAMEKQKNGEQS
jgi:hypothetical protein